MGVHVELHEALHYLVLLYQTVASWVQVFKNVRHFMLLSMTVIEQCLNKDRHWTVKKLTKHTGIYGFTVPHIL